MGAYRLDLMAYRGKTFDLAMRHFSMTFPASAVCPAIMMVFDKAFHLRIDDLGAMTADAIVLNDFYGRLSGFNDFRFCSERKYGGVIQPILGFKIILVEYIVVRHMTVVATGNFTVRTARPSNVLRRHHMAVHTGLGIVRKIGSSVAQLQYIQTQTKKSRHQDYDRGAPPFRRNQVITKNKPLKLLKSCHNLCGIAEKAMKITKH